MKNILAFGEILWDIINGEAHIGGAPLNFAAHCEKCGLSSGIVSALGDDTLGKKALKSVVELGIAKDQIQTHENKPTGTVLVELNSGQPSYSITEDVAYDYIKPINSESISAFDYFYFGTLCQRNDTSRSTLLQILDTNKFEHVFYDVNLRAQYFSKSIIENSFSRCSILKMNDEEVELLERLLFQTNEGIPTFCKRIITQYPNIQLIIITLGAKGCAVYDKAKLIHVPSTPVIVKDTVGAGDSFSASFLTQFLKHGDTKRSATIANKIGGFVASADGAIPEYSDELKKLLN